MRLLAVLILLLAGCAGAPSQGIDAGRLVLLAPLTIPPESATVRLQYGKPVARRTRVRFRPLRPYPMTTTWPLKHSAAP